MSDIFDGGSAFPIPLDDRPGAFSAEPGMSKRELYAGMLLQGLVTRGPLTDVDQAAESCCEAADALLRALRGPQPVQYREMHPSEKRLIEAAEHARAAMYQLRQNDAVFDFLPPDVRELISKAVTAFEEAEIPF